MEQTFFDVLVDIESIAGQIYQIFAERFPAQRAVWRELAREERRHAEWLVELHLAAQEELLTFSLNRERGQLARAWREEMRHMLQRAPECTAQQAVQMAQTIENSVLEKQFYEVMAGKSVSAAPIFTALISATSRHADRLAELEVSE